MGCFLLLLVATDDSSNEFAALIDILGSGVEEVELFQKSYFLDYALQSAQNLRIAVYEDGSLLAET